MSTVTCGFCGTDFSEEASRRACAACSLWGGGCNMVRCPRCGYEMPEEPGLVKLFRKWRRRDATG